MLARGDGANIYFPNLHNSITPQWTMKQHTRIPGARAVGPAGVSGKEATLEQDQQQQQQHGSLSIPFESHH